jgi:hypothetical protein
LVRRTKSTFVRYIYRRLTTYTWTTPDGKEEEMDGLAILAIILNCIWPHYKIDMYLEIDKLKKETLAQYEDDVDLYNDC